MKEVEKSQNLTKELEICELRKNSDLLASKNERE
jgi:hypothetical protein